MPTVFQLRFPGRRYHATPWGHHVNEGRVEWPPSPWRLLRALLATGFSKLHWPAEGPPPLARRMIERLASVLPAYGLPPATMAHSRHYVDANDKRPLIIDAWAQVDDGVVEVVWDLDLPAEEHEILARLADQLGYLGRAESWTLAQVVEQPSTPINCRPSTDGQSVRSSSPVRVLCPLTPSDYAEWRTEQVSTIEAEHGPTAGRAMTAAQKKRRDAALRPFPADLIAALCADTTELKAQGWTSAPGSRDVLYDLPADALAVRATPALRPARTPPVPFALLTLATASRGTSALPPLHRAFPQGRLLHKAIAHSIRKDHGEDEVLAALLLGRTPAGRVEGKHEHAHLLHLDLDGDQRLDHVLVYAPAGLDGRAQEVLRGTLRTWMKGGAGELAVALAALGDADALRRLTEPYGSALGDVLGPPEGARRWMSATPWVAPRLLKRKGKDSIEGQVRLECQRRGLPELVEVRICSLQEERARAMRHYVLHDARHQPPWPARFFLELSFAEPLQGPLCLGYGSHYGLGRFQSR